MAGLLAIAPAVLAVYFGGALAATASRGPILAEWPWAPSLGLSLAFHLDGLALLFAVLITGIGTLIVIYAATYLADHPHAGRFHATLFAFMGSMLGIVLADNLLTLFVFWELTGFTSFLLIGFEHQRSEARAAALQALIVTGAGGLALLAGAALIGHTTGTVRLSALLASGVNLAGNSLYVPIALLFLLAACTKSAQFPFHFWLPRAMAAPTPVSAYLHSATMVKAGVYLVARMTPILGGAALWTATLTAVGAVTMVVGGWRAVCEHDLKRVLAYSTVSALGMLMMLLGIGTHASVTAALVYLVAHACYKGALFLVAGTIDHAAATRDVTRLGGLRRAMPITAAAAMLSAASMAGAPLFLGFVAKEQIYEAAWQADAGHWLLATAVAGSALAGAAALLAGVAPFYGRAPQPLELHEAPIALSAGPLLLGATGLIALAPIGMERALGAAATSILRSPAEVSVALWHGFTPILMLSLLTLAAAFALYRMRAFLAALPVGWVASTEPLYAASIGLLDRVSRAISPALQSASLRSNVLAVVVGAGVLIGGALIAGGGPRALRVTTDIRAHEVLVLLLIVAGAISAARATSSMAAVLSLGMVGYGVALIFLFFGAPDLAMTQFSVETLTVVIFVSVFYHFQQFEGLSPVKVRVRDALVATAFGTIIAILVLLVSTSGTPSRLAGYFVEVGPTLGHGRNIVNVILVDFRSLDTLGEITVLTTAAIGVRALVQLGAGPGNRP